MDELRYKKLDEMFEALSLIAEGAYVYLCDMRSDYSRWSKTAVEQFGLPDEYMFNAGELWKEHIHPDDRCRYDESIKAIFAGNASGHDMQYRARAVSGDYMVCTCRGIVIRDAEGVPEYFGGVIRNHDILNYLEPVTGLRSLYGYFDDIRSMLLNHMPALVICIGITGFSDFNDVYGYRFGNRVLQKLARGIQAAFVNSVSVYRLDGPRFAVITGIRNIDEINGTYEQLRQSMRSTELDGTHISISLNAGCFIMDDFSINTEMVYSCLKYAYYESKHCKMGDLVLFDSSVSENTRSSIEKLNEIRSSIADNCRGFFLCYQPIVDSETEELTAVEALIRWQNKEYGIVPPSEFISFLEQDTLFPELGWWIIRSAVSDGKKMLEYYPDIVINVNLSYTQLRKTGFAHNIIIILKETGFPPEHLCLEITERCRLLDISFLKETLTLLKNHGIKIALDDFGTGFSSLGVMRELPIDTVKIDRDFVRNIETSRNDQSTVQCVSDMAAAFGTKLCVEGVETDSMRDFLRRYNINSFQGYYYSKPMTTDKLFEKYCRNQ